MVTGLPDCQRALRWIAPAFAIVLSPSAAGATGAAGAAAPSRVDSRLQLALERVSGRSPVRARENDPQIGCLLRVRDVVRVSERVVALGGRVGTVAGDVVSAQLPPRAVRLLARDPLVVRIEAGTPLRPRLDRVASTIHLDSLRSEFGPTSSQGASVIVGVVDLSLDITHPAFKADGRSRVVALWEQTGSQSPPPGYDYGRYCDQEMLAVGDCPLFVFSEHGTHVTGIAAGSQVAGSRYTGIAPAADIVFVSLGDPVDSSMSFDEWLSVAVCDAVGFVFDVAEQRGQPAVVNLSLGTHTGPHDGSSLASACLDNLTGPGRIIVAAAGNEGEPWIHPRLDELVYVHAGGSAVGGESRVDFVVGDYVVEGDIVDIWAEPEGGSPTLQLGVQVHGGEPVMTQPLAVGDALHETHLATAAGDFGPITIATDRAPSGSVNFQVTVSDDDGDFAEVDGDWFFVLADAGRFDAFLDVNGGGGFVQRDPEVRVDARMSIGYPAVARNVIAVGSFVSRTEWMAASGDAYEIFDYLTGDALTLGQLSTFSSRGPTRNPEATGPKPDLVAPGEMVASAMAAGRGLDITEESIVAAAPGGYFVAGGTSQAAPVVSGVVALLLERDPFLDPAAVRELLRGSAELPRGVTPPSNDWGFGRVDAAAAVAATPDLGPSVDPDPAPVGTAARSETDGGCSCTVPSAGGIPGNLRWSWLLGLGLVVAGCSSHRGRRERENGRKIR